LHSYRKKPTCIRAIALNVPTILISPSASFRRFTRLCARCFADDGVSTGGLGTTLDLSNPNTAGATGLCLDVHDLVLSKYAAGREKDMAFNQALVRCGCVAKETLLNLAVTLPVDDEMKATILRRINADFASANS
jgi:hypothetical protein